MQARPMHRPSTQQLLNRGLNVLGGQALEPTAVEALHAPQQHRHGKGGSSLASTVGVGVWRASAKAL